MTEPASFTQKEMLVRIDAKVDVIAAKQANYDVELALLKARQEEQVRTSREKQKEHDTKYEALDKRIDALTATQESFSRRLTYATGAISVIVVAANWLVPATVRHFLG